ncbi:MAG: class I SAM-dependent methyltransferase [Patescibacteria group bacterium]|nr:class I SAM-dependent methyltransferase [Patescibacteria group bacterium]
MQHETVEKLFSDQAQYYSEDPSVATSQIVPLFLEWAKFKKYSKICEFGGAGGRLLAELEKKSSKKLELYNAEIIEDYKKYQVSKKIKFSKNSILNSKFQNHSFDVLIVRDVLHHLIGRNFFKTRENQEKALQELKRLLKPGGAIFIEELVNESGLATKIIYYLSKLNSKIGIKSKFLEISPYTIVAFLTPELLHQKVKKTFGIHSIYKQKYLPFNTRWYERLVHLGMRSGKLILVIAKI